MSNNTQTPLSVNLSPEERDMLAGMLCRTVNECLYWLEGAIEDDYEFDGGKTHRSVLRSRDRSEAWVQRLEEGTVLTVKDLELCLRLAGENMRVQYKDERSWIEACALIDKLRERVRYAKRQTR